MIDPYVDDPTEDTGQSWQPAPQQAEFQPPMIPEPWTAADDLQLTKFNNAASHVREKLADNELSEQTADALMRQINGTRGPMLARQEQAKDRARNEQQQALLHANATAKSIQLQNLQADARALPGQIVTDVDPETGEITRFAPKGQFEALEKRETEPPSGSSMGAGARPKEWDQPTIEAKPDGTHTMTIWNGGQRSEISFAQDPESPTGWRTTAQQNYDENNNPVQPGQQQADPTQLSQADDRRLWLESAQALNIDPRRLATGRLTAQEQTSLRAVYNRKAAELRVARAQQARELDQARQEQRKDEQTLADKFDVELRDERRSLQRELDRWRADPLNAKKAVPEHLKDIDGSAEKKVGDRWKRQGKALPQGFGAPAQKSTESKDSVATPKPTNENPLGLEAGTESLGALMAEKKRREPEKQKKADAGRAPVEPTFMESLGFRW
jgi:hypothetical protein